MFVIYTLTLNPAIDYKIKVDRFEVNQLNRFKKGTLHPGGKGINVSVVLKNLGIDSVPITFLGGFTGHYLYERIKKEHKLELDPIWIDGDTRINIKMTVDHETEINHDGPRVKDDKFELITNRIKTLNKDDLVIVGGSAPYGQRDAFQQIADICHQRDIPFIMDTPGDMFHQFIDFKPFLMKPNLKELNDYLLMDLFELDEIIFYGRQLIYRGVEHLIISLGSRGSLYLDNEKAYLAHPITGKVVSSIGAGDSMVAGFVAMYQLTQDPKLAFIEAVAAASATVFGGKLATHADIQKYQTKVVIEEL
ncbi:MAG: 1-phosphofructokinase family hexose kinase [Acholeplasmataceae bacterium]